MATRKFYQDHLDRVVAVRDQKEADSKVDATIRGFAKQHTNFGAKMTDSIKTYEEAGIDVELVGSVINQLDEWARKLNPQVDVWWNKEEVSTDLTFLNASVTAGVITDEADVALIAEVSDALKSLTSGARSEKQEQAPIEGRPPRVWMLDAEGNKVYNRKANTASSLNNLTQGALDYIVSATGQPSKEEVATLKAAIQKVLDTGKKQTFAGLTFDPRDE